MKKYSPGDVIPEDVLFPSSKQFKPGDVIPEDDLFPQQTSATSVAKDTGIALLKGFKSIGDAAVGLADIPTLGQAGRAAELIGSNEVTGDPFEADRMVSENRQRVASGEAPAYVPVDPYSKPMQRARQAVDSAEGFIPTLQSYVENPSALYADVVEAIPGTVAGGAVGAGLAPVAERFLPKIVPAISQKTAQLVGAAAGEGVVSAGSQAEQTRQQSESGTLSPLQSGLAALSGVGTSAFGYFGGKLAQKLGFADPDTLFANLGNDQARKKGFLEAVKRIVGGGISEGVFEEMPQGIQETILQNAALNKPLMEGVPAAAAQNLAAGLAMGGIANIRQPGEAKTQTREEGQSEEKQPLQPLATGLDAIPQPDVIPPNGEPIGTISRAAAAAEKTEPAASTILDTVLSPEPQDGTTVAGQARVEGPLPPVDILRASASGTASPSVQNVDQGKISEDLQREESLQYNKFRNQQQQRSTFPGQRAATIEATPSQRDYELYNPNLPGSVDQGYGHLPKETRALIPAINKMVSEVSAGQVSGSYQDESGVTSPTVSSYPEWFKQRTVSKYNKETGQNISLSKERVVNVLQRVKDGKPLRGGQAAIWSYLRDVAASKGKTDPEVQAQHELNRLSDEGFRFNAPKNIVAGNLKPGDTVVIENNGIPDKILHKGFDKDGNAILQDGVTMHVDPFEQLQVIAERPGASKITDEERDGIISLVNRIRNKTTVRDVRKISREIVPFFKQNAHLEPYREMVLGAVRDARRSIREIRQKATGQKVATSNPDLMAVEEEFQRGKSFSYNQQSNRTDRSSGRFFGNGYADLSSDRIATPKSDARIDEIAKETQAEGQNTPKTGKNTIESGINVEPEKKQVSEDGTDSQLGKQSKQPVGPGDNPLPGKSAGGEGSGGVGRGSNEDKAVTGEVNQQPQHEQDNGKKRQGEGEKLLTGKVAESADEATTSIAKTAGVRKIEGGGVTYELPESNIQRKGSDVNSAPGDQTREPGIQNEPEIYYATEPEKKKRTAFQAKIGTIKTDVERVYSPESAARILEPLGKKAQETLQALILDKKNKPLAVLQHSVGGPVSNQVFPSQLLGSIVNTKGAKSFYIAHNHPSGTLTPSVQDVALTKAIDNIIRGAGVGFAGHIIVSPTGEAIVLDSQGDEVGRFGANAKTGQGLSSVKITERQLRGDIPNVTQQKGVGGSRDAMALVEGLPPGVLLLDNMYRPIEFVGVTIREMGALRDSGTSRSLLSKLDIINDAAAAIIKINNKARDLSSAKNLITFLKAAQVKTVDVIDSNMEAMSESASVPPGREDNLFYSQTTNPTGSTVYLGQREIAGQYNARVKIVQSAGELPDGVKFMVAWHGSPHDHDGFRMDKVGTGEGAQAYGYGLYFAGAKEVAEFYRKQLSPPSEFRNFSVGSVELVRNGKYVDYSPKDRTLLSEARAKVAELILADERTILNTFDTSGEAGAKKLIAELIDNEISYMQDEYPEIVSSLKILRNSADRITRLDVDQNKGRLYQVDLAPQEDEYLLWDKPLSEQSEKVRKAIDGAAQKFDEISAEANALPDETAADEKKYNDLIAERNKYSAFKVATKGKNIEKYDGNALYHALTEGRRDGISDKAASEYLKSIGIRGIKYLDGSSRGKGDGNYNYVIFDESDVKITAKYQKQQGQIQGAFEPNSDTIYLVADHIAQGEWASVLHHEGFHRAMASDKFDNLLSDLERMEKRFSGNGVMGRWFEQARAKAQVDKGKPHYIEEIGAYAVSNYQTSPNVIKAWVDKLVAKLKLFLRQIGVRVALSPAMLREVAARGLMARTVEPSGQETSGMLTPAVAKYSKAEIVKQAKAFFSKLQQIAEDKFRGMKAQSVEPFLLKQGVKKTEIEATGLREWLAGKKPTDKVTREQLSDFVQANTVEFEDVVLGDGRISAREWAKKNGYFVSFDRDSGGYIIHDQQGRISKDWEGNLLVGKTEDEAFVILEDYIPESSSMDNTHFSNYTEPGAEPGSYREMFVTAPGISQATGDNLPLGYWAKEDSDGLWRVYDQDHDAAFGTGRSERDAIANAIAHGAMISNNEWQDGHSQYSDIKNPIVRIRFNIVTDTEGRKILRVEEMQGPSNSNQAKMPKHLKENIYQTGVKRILAYAKENGFDGVALATRDGMTAGQTQADRYSLEKQIKSIHYYKYGNDEEFYGLDITDNDGHTYNETTIKAEELPKYVGKELAVKIVNSGYRNDTITGLDLKVGGEGLKQLYDKDLPNIFKAWGGQAMGEIKANGATMPYIPITNKTPESFPLYSKKESGKQADTNSKEFKKWFGRSRVIDENGAPRPVYHGSTTFGQESFSFEYRAPSDTKTISPGAGMGFFFAEDRNESLPYAGTGGKVFDVYLNIENPLVTNSYELPLFNTREAASAFRKRKELEGYDGVYLRDEGHWIAFRSDQIKSADLNNGNFSKRNSDIRYSVAYDEDVATQGKIVERMPDKPDIGFLKRILSTPEYIFKEFPATWKMFKAALNRQQEKYEMENDILGDFLPSAQSAQKESPEEYKTANDILLETDKTGSSFRLKHQEQIRVVHTDGSVIGVAESPLEAGRMIDADSARTERDKKDYREVRFDQWTVKDPKGKALASFENEQDAAQAMTDAESAELAKRGISPRAIKLIASFRGMTNRAFDRMIADMRRIRDEVRALDLQEPRFDIPDEERRWGVYVGNKLSGAFLTRADAMAAVEIKRAANKAANNGDDGSVEVSRRPDKEIMKSVSLTEAIAMMSDLRGQYFPRQRQPGEIILRAEKDGRKIMKKYDLYLTPKQRVNSDTGEKISHPVFNRLRRAFNTTTGYLPFIETLEKEANRLKNGGWDVSIEKQAKTPETIFDAMKLVASMDALVREAATGAKKGQKAAEETYEQVNKILTANLADLFKQRGYLSSRMHRSQEYWEGFETDMLLAGTQYARGVAAGIAKRNAAQRMIMAITGRDQTWSEWRKDNPEGSWEEYNDIVNKQRLDPNQQPVLYGEAMDWMREVLRNDERIDRVIGTMRGLAAMKFLGFRVSSAAVNATNMVMAVPASISSMSKGSISGAFMAINNAAAEYYKFRRGREMSDDDRKIFLEISNRGWDQPQFNHEAASVLMSKVGRFWNRFGDLAMMMFGAVEKANRATTIFAAYKEVVRNTNLKREDALSLAKEISDRAHGTYGKHANPSFVRGSANPAKLLYTFQKFSHNYLLNMTEMGLKGDLKEAAYMLLSPAILGGAGATLLTPVVAGLAKALGVGGDDPEEEFYKWAEKTFGTDSWVRHGLPGLVGINLKGSIEINNPLPTKITELLGAPGAIATDTYRAYKLAKKGEMYKASEALFPTAIGSAIRAVREGREGITTGSYSPVYYGTEAIKATTGEQLWRAFSFNPSRISGIRELQWNEKKVAAEYAARKSEITEKLKRYYLFGSGDINELRAEWMRYNELVRGSGRADIPLLTYRGVQQAVVRARKPSKQERIRQYSFDS